MDAEQELTNAPSTDLSSPPPELPHQGRTISCETALEVEPKEESQAFFRVPSSADLMGLTCSEGARVTAFLCGEHAFYLEDGQSWDEVLPKSLRLEGGSFATLALENVEGPKRKLAAAAYIENESSPPVESSTDGEVITVGGEESPSPSPAAATMPMPFMQRGHGVVPHRDALQGSAKNTKQSRGALHVPDDVPGSPMRAEASEGTVNFVIESWPLRSVVSYLERRTPLGGQLPMVLDRIRRSLAEGGAPPEQTDLVVALPRHFLERLHYTLQYGGTLTEEEQATLLDPLRQAMMSAYQVSI